MNIGSEKKSVKQFSVWHHRYDEQTKHFKWFEIQSFDSEKEMNAHLKKLWAELALRVQSGNAPAKEQYVGRTSQVRKKIFHFFR